MKRQSDLQRLLCRSYVKLIVAFLTPVLVMLLMYFTVGIYPYRSKTLLYSDLEGQYVNFFLYLKYAILEGRGLFYSFSKTLGGDLYGLAAYYLFSPLNWLFLFSTEENLPIVLLLVTLLKVGLSGLTFYLFISSRRGYYYKYIGFAVAYALSGYVVAYSFQLLWLDAVYMLPLVILGLERAFLKKGNALFVVAVAISILVGYYTGYMVCLFAALYGIYYFLIMKAPWKQKIGRIFPVLGSAALGVGISMAVLLPALAAQNESRAIGSTFFENANTISLVDATNLANAGEGAASTVGSNSLFHLQLNPMEWLNGLYNYNGNLYGLDYNLPYLFVSIPVLVLIVCYFFNNRLRLRERIASGVVMIILAMCMCIEPLDRVWHGFAKPNMFFYRYSFVVAFFLVYLGYRSYANLRGIQAQKILWLAGAITAVGAILCKIFVANGNDWVHLGLELCLIVLTLLCLSHRMKPDREIRTIMDICFLLTIVASLVVTGDTHLSQMEYSDDSICGFMEEISQGVDYVKRHDSGTYRIEKTFYESQNDAMLLDYYGLSHFSSSDNPKVLKLMEQLGYTRNQNFWSYYDTGATMGADSLLGVKYIFSRTRRAQNLELMAEGDNYYIYRNPYALSLIFGIPKAELKLSGTDSFLNLNSFYENTTNQKEIYTDVYKTEKLWENDEVVHFNVTSEVDADLYMEATDLEEGGYAELYVNGESFGPYLDTYHKGVIHLGYFLAGNAVDVKLILHGIKDLDPVFMNENRERLAHACEILQKSAASKIHFITDSHIEAQIEMEEDGAIFTTIPYSDNWSVYLDGKKVIPTETMDALLLIQNVEKGTHSIEMRYTPRYLYLGVTISTICIAGLILLLMTETRRKKHEIQPL